MSITYVSYICCICWHLPICEFKTHITYVTTYVKSSWHVFLQMSEVLFLHITKHISYVTVCNIYQKYVATYVKSVSHMCCEMSGNYQKIYICFIRVTTYLFVKRNLSRALWWCWYCRFLGPKCLHFRMLVKQEHIFKAEYRISRTPVLGVESD